MKSAVTDQELRSLVREAIARHVERSGADTRPHDAYGRWGSPHASHMLLPLARGSDGDGACLIEPTVRCIHCGYCLSYGH